MQYAPLALPRRRLLWPVLALGGMLLAGCATTRFKEHTKRGFEYQKEKFYSIAATEFREAVRLKPNDARAHYNLAYVLEEQGTHTPWGWEDMIRMYYESITEYREAIRLKPGWAEAHCQLGLVYSNLGPKYDSAMAEFRETLRLKPGFEKALGGIKGCSELESFIMELDGKHEEAIGVLREAVKYIPEDGNLYWRWGTILDKQGRRKEARQYWEKALKYNRSTDDSERKHIRQRLAEPR